MSDYYVVENQSLADVAQAIRDKTGKLDALEFPDEFISEIESISGGDTPAPQDGKTRIYCFFKEGRLSPVFGLGVNGTVDIDWGDNTTHGTLTGTSTGTFVSTTHTYAEGGEYCVIITPTTGTTFAFMGNSTQNASLVFSKDPNGIVNEQRVYLSSMRKVIMGDGARIGGYAFAYCYRLHTIEFTSETTTFGTTAFTGCYGLGNAILPSNATMVSPAMYRYCYVLPNIEIPDTVTAIGNSAFQNCSDLSIIEVGSGVTTIGTNSFGNCYGAKEYHFKSTTPPTISSTNTFSNIPSDCIIYVPYSADHSVLNAYKTATNWSTYESYIQEELQ